jgi:sporulation protein YlmC with PRC-barrel domain
MQTSQDVQTWRGMKVVDADGDKVGTIQDVFLDRQTGEPEWATVKTGLFGLKSSFVPIRDAEVIGDNEVRVPYQKEQIKDAPRVDDDELTPEEERRLWEHYGRNDYDEWQGEDRTTALDLPAERREGGPQSGDGDQDREGAPVIVGVRLRRVVMITSDDAPGAR